MKKSILKILLVLFLIPLAFSACKDNNRNRADERLDVRERTTTSDAADKIDHAVDKVEEKANRLVGDYEKALEKARDRVRNADDEIRKAIADGDQKAEERARESKRNAEREIEDLQQKIREKNRNE